MLISVLLLWYMYLFIHCISQKTELFSVKIIYSNIFAGYWKKKNKKVSLAFMLGIHNYIMHEQCIWNLKGPCQFYISYSSYFKYVGGLQIIYQMVSHLKSKQTYKHLYVYLWKNSFDQWVISYYWTIVLQYAWFNWCDSPQFSPQKSFELGQLLQKHFYPNVI